MKQYLISDMIKVKGVYRDLEYLFDKKALWGKSGTLIWVPDKEE
ncbi:MAG: hypothetical protein PHW73_01750 [Atribacterota bacterium]|nr:hypothetical protein [Atribacterota bacterium]